MPNPLPKTAEIVPFAGWDDLEVLDLELGEPLAAIVGGTGLRPEEFLAVEWRDIDRTGRVLRVRRTVTEMGGLREYGSGVSRGRRWSSEASQLAETGVEAGMRGGWARRAPALRSAPHLPTMSIAAGVSLFMLARRMGTSVEMIDRTYGHLTADAAVYELELLDAFDAQSGDSAGVFGRRVDAADNAG